MSHKTLTLSPKPRGFHLITQEIEQLLQEQGGLPESGVLFLQLMHTSAGLTLNENADPTVRLDFENFINKLVPEDEPYFEHIYEGADDMPAHIKSSLFGTQLQLIIKNFKLVLGSWQGIYLCEFRNHASSREIRSYVI